MVKTRAMVMEAVVFIDLPIIDSWYRKPFTEQELLAIGDEIKLQIRRHIDLPEGTQVFADVKTCAVCVYCGIDPEPSPDDGYPQCCGKAQNDWEAEQCAINTNALTSMPTET